MQLKMRLLSETIFSSGEGVGNIIDIDVVYDEMGIPIIPSKRIKGVLREYAEELCSYNILNRDKFNRIFGIPGSSQPASLKLSNGYIKDYKEIKSLIKLINSKKENDIYLPAELVIKSFTSEFSQTAIEDGVAKEKSLRTLRALKKGLEFYFDIDLEDDLIDDFKKVCKVSRHFGLSRSRGFGNIKLTLINTNKEKEKPLDNIKTTDRINFYIKADEPLVLYDPTYGINRSLSYIPGSSINGFFAGMYIKKFGTDDDFYDIFINGKVKFLNAYPEGSLPTPFSLMRKKDSDKIYFMDDEKQAEKVKKENIQTKEFGHEFITFKDGKPKGIDTNMTAVYHHRRPEDKSIGSPTKEDGEFFQFEVIDKNQRFLSMIEGEEKLLSKLLSTIPQKGVSHIGKSKTAQYGKIHFKWEEGNLRFEKIKWKKDSSIVVYFYTDAIILNENGFNSTKTEDIKRNIAEILGENEIEVKKAFINEKIVGGYLSIWNLPKIQKVAISSGSIVKLKNNSDRDIEIDNENFYIGIRNSEGYGRLIALPNTQDLSAIFSQKASQEEQNIKPRINRYIKETLINYCINNEVNKNLSKINLNRLNISNHLISRTMEIILLSNSAKTLNEKLSSFKEKAAEQLKEIKDILKLTINTKENSILVNSDWNNFINEKLKDIPVKIEETDFIYYKRYALAILKYLLYANKSKGAQ